MDMTGEYRIPAPRQRVWEALNDPEILKAAIPGCEALTKLADDALEARVKAKVGPVSATFTGKVTLGDLNPPESYTISGEGKGGAAGFAKGGAQVALAEEGAAVTILRYQAKADVGGKLAQIGSRLIQGTAKKMADDFFGRFTALVGQTYAAEGGTSATTAAAPPTPAEAFPAAPPVPPSPQGFEPAVAPGPTPAASAAPPPPPAPPPVPPAGAAPVAAAMPAAATGTPPPAPKQVAFAPERPATAPTTAAAPPAKGGQPWWVWLAGLIVLVIVLFWLLG